MRCSTKVLSLGILDNVPAEVVTAQFNSVIKVTFSVIVFERRPNGIHPRAFCNKPDQKFHVSNA